MRRLLIVLETAFVLSIHSSDMNEIIKPYKASFCVKF